MTPEELYQTLKSGKIPTLVCLSGQEPYLLQRAVQFIRKSVLVDDRDSFNDNQFFGKEVTADQVLEAAMTLPVFAPKRLVTVKDAQLLSSTEMDALLPYLQDPAPETCLLFVSEKIDSRRKFFQQLKKNGVLVEFKPLAERELPQYVRNSLDQNDTRMTSDALSLFCSMVSTSLHEVHTELDKLLIFTGGGGVIDVKDVQAIVSRGKAENVFEIGNAVARGDASAALSLVLRLRVAGEAPLKILSLLVRHFRQLWKVRELQSQKYPVKDIARMAGVPFFVVDSLIQQGSRFARKDFIRAHEMFLETDLAMKSSGADPEALLDNLILRLIKRTD